MGKVLELVGSGGRDPLTKLGWIGSLI